jgi:large subunit ribosomal protein L5
MGQRLKRLYCEQVVPELNTKFCYSNKHQIPQLTKIVVNRGIGTTGQNTKIIELLLTELATITAQFGMVTRSRKSIASFKVRAKSPIGLIVTLRGERIYAFLDRFINLALPRIRDFQGVSINGFDGRGNYNLGLDEQLIFPEICYDNIDHLCGINFSIVTSAHTDKERRVLLSKLGIPFYDYSDTLFFMTTDTFSERLTCIRNALYTKKTKVEVPNTQIINELCKILHHEGFIENVQISSRQSHKKKYGSYLCLDLKYVGTNQISIISNLQRVSGPKLRMYVNYKQIPKVIGGLGLVFCRHLRD